MKQDQSCRWRHVRRLMIAAVVAGMGIAAAADTVIVKKIVQVVPTEDLMVDPIESVPVDGKLELLERKNGFVKVKTPTGKIGFISEDDLPVNYNASGLSGPLGSSSLSTSAAGKGLEKDAEEYVKARHIKKEPLEKIIAWGKAITIDDLKEFDHAGHVGGPAHR